ncbi:DeoR/GlpR family DNA-binding transcription regulator [Psychromicrobium xiongbiense]|uniref:DeoR/GlpR family DNA-binding transcription regulator n=1 Tax=Psychromicrobium xiongbiense TaxID=3051184 RepID=UPI0025531A1E|nr:DeoR/GlpR family DNA-binding transcription regulator [Psychromicrobium sp. YIM S02556]
MLTHQREAAIVARLRDAGSVTVEELAHTLEVSGSTIRRDLERLELVGQLQRVHGGATASQQAPQIAPGLAEPADRDEDVQEKVAIAIATARLIQDGDVVLLDIGHSTLQVAWQLRGRPVTVITNNLSVLKVLADDPVTSLILLGGLVGAKPSTLSGPLTEEALALIRADVAVISSTGVRPDGSVVTDLTQEARLKQRMREVADRSILLATSLKFPGDGSYRIAFIQDFDVVVSTSLADPKALDLAVKAGKDVLRVPV